MEPDSQQTPAGTTQAVPVKKESRVTYIVYACVLLFSFMWFYLSFLILKDSLSADGMRHTFRTSFDIYKDSALQSPAFVNFVLFDLSFAVALGFLLPVLCALQITKITWIKQALFSIWLYKSASYVFYAFFVDSHPVPGLGLAAFLLLMAAFTFQLLRAEKKPIPTGCGCKPVSRKFTTAVTTALLIFMTADFGYAAHFFGGLLKYENRVPMEKRSKELFGLQTDRDCRDSDQKFVDPLKPADDRAAAALVEKEIAAEEVLALRATGKEKEGVDFYLFMLKSSLADIYCYKLNNCVKAIEIDKEIEKKYSGGMGLLSAKAHIVKTGWHYYRKGDRLAAHRYASRGVGKKTKRSLKTPSDTADFYNRLENSFYIKSVYLSEKNALDNFQNKKQTPPATPRKPKQMN